MLRRLHPAALALFISLTPTTADTVQLPAQHDNTLVEDAQGSLSMGKSFHMYSGRVGSNGEGTRRRALIRFDIAGTVPSGSTITAASLTLRMAQSATGAQIIQLRRMLADWGEGNSFGFGGYGAPAAPGDATWLHTFWPGAFWQTAGGEYSPVVSASRSVGGVGFYTWNSTPLLVEDVQLWLDAPDQNFGWMLLGNESQIKTVKKFDTRDTDFPPNAPVLSITFTPPPPCDPPDLNCDGHVDAADLGLLLAKWGTSDPTEEPNGDLNGDGIVDGGDLGDLLGAWAP